MKPVFLFICTFLLNIGGFSQVNPQNGSGYYQIPIFNFSDQKSGLSTDVSLNYSSGNGLIVGEKASNIGQGWTLNAGGVVARRQYGEPDDQNSTSLFPTMPLGNFRGFSMHMALYEDNYQSINYSGDPYSRDYIDNYFPNGFMYSEFPVVMLEPESNQWPLDGVQPRELGIMPRFKSNWDKKYKSSRRTLTDREQDIYTFNVGGLSGDFVIGKDGVVQLLNDSKLKIQYTTENLLSQNIRTRIKEFVIRDQNGIDYKFASYDLNEVLIPEETASYGTSAFAFKLVSGTATGKYVIPQWHLTEIINPETLEKIVFNYESFDVNQMTNQTPVYQSTVGESAETVQLMINTTKGILKRISSVVFPDGHRLDFNYNRGFTRPDFADDDPLWKILLTHNAEEKYTYTFSQGYFLRKEVKDITVAASAADKRFTRLCLKSLQKTYNGKAEPPYNFTYYTGSESSDLKDIVPPFDCLAEDHWGFYTKNTNLDIEAALTKESIKELLLNPTTYRLPTSGLAALGLLKSVETPTGGQFKFDYEQNYSKNADNTSQTLMHGGVRVLKTTLSDGVSANNDIVTNYYYKNADGTSSGWGYENNQYTSSKLIEVYNAGNLEGFTETGNNRQAIVSILRNINSSLIKSAKFNLLGTLGKKGAEKAAIPPLPAPQALLFKLILEGFMKRVFVLFNPSDHYTTNFSHFNSQQYRNPLGVNYSRVEVVNSSVPGGTGKTIYEFSAPANVRSEIPALTMPYSSKQRFESWRYGLPTKMQVFSQAGTLLKETVNNYSVTSSAINTNDYNKSSKVEVLEYHSASAITYNMHGQYPLSQFSWEFYYPKKGKADLVSTVETNYSSSGLQNQLTTSYEYNTDHLPKKITTPKSNGDLIVQKTYYANDFDNNVSTAIAQMKLRNVISVPVSVETWLVKPNATEYLIDASVNEFFLASNNEIKLNKVYALETNQPILKATIGEHNPNQLIRNSTYFKLKSTMLYDINGIHKESFSPDGRYSSLFYDFAGRYVTAKVWNAHTNEAAYSSFETNEKGNWVYDLANVTSTTGAVMGKKCFRIPQGSAANLYYNCQISKPMRLTFWTKGAGTVVNHSGNALTPTISLVNSTTGWTYYEYKFTGTGNVYISKATSTDFVDIDEVRLYPQQARMSSMHTDSKIGTTSECDINNKISYYEYDDMLRLSYIRDEQKNIIKKICYNYAGEPENCIDAQDTSPQWRDDGLTMCEACPSNPAYYSGVRLKRQIDQNPLSLTYNQPQWIVDNSGTCPVNADWVQRTDLGNCELNGSGQPTGNYVIPTADINPCSPTYNQWGTPVIIPNHGPCIPCNPACSEPQYKCINGVCVQGTWSIVRVFRVDKFTWQCTSAYCFPDGSVSNYTQTTTSSTACTITCP